MGVIVKQSSRSTFISYIGVVFGVINTMFFYPRFLTPELVGIMRLLLEVATILALFCQLGSSQSIIKFYPFFKNDKTKDYGFFFYVTVIPLIGIIIFGSLFFIFGGSIKDYYSGKSPLFLHYYILIIPFALFLVFINSFEAYLNARLKIVFPKILREVVLRILTALIVFGFFLKILNENNFIYAYVGLFGFIVLSLILFTVKNETISFKPDFSIFTPILKKEIYWFMGFMIIAGIGNSIVNRIDVLILGAKLGTRELGIFSISFFIASIIELPYRSIGQISAPIVSEAIKMNDWKLVQDVYKKSALNQFIIAGFIFFLIWININNLFGLMPNGVIYRQGIWVVLFIGLAKIIDSASGINALIIGYSSIYRLNMLYMVFLLGLAYLTNNALIPVFGITGSALATAISILIYNLLLCTTIWFKFHIQPFSKEILYVLLIFTILFILDFFLPSFANNILDSLFRSSIIIALFVFAILKFKISSEIQGIVKFWVKKIPFRAIRNKIHYFLD